MSVLKILAANAVASGGTPVLTYQGTLANLSGTTSSTWTNASLGTPSSDRLVVIVITGYGGTSRQITGCTVAGVSATSATNVASSGGCIGIFYINDTTNTTANIVFTHNNPAAKTVAVYSITGLNSFTPLAAFSTGNTSQAITTQANGIVLAGTVTFGGTVVSVDSPLVFDFNQVINVGGNLYPTTRSSGISSTTSTTVTINYSPVGTDRLGAASWR